MRDAHIHYETMDTVPSSSSIIIFAMAILVALGLVAVALIKTLQLSRRNRELGNQAIKDSTALEGANRSADELKQSLQQTTSRLEEATRNVENLRAMLADRQGRLEASSEKISMQERLIEQCNEREKELAAKVEVLQAELTKSSAELSRLNERLQLLTDEKEQADAQADARFKLIASQVLESNSKRFTNDSQQQIEQVLAPLKENIERFSKSVAEAYSNEARERFALSERIKELVQLNETIGTEARELTRALRGDSKVQGDWGEMILERLLEKSGLLKGVHFDLQLTRDSDGNTIRDNEGHLLRPDAVIYYPDGRCAIVDSKVSLTGYIDMMNADTASPQYSDACQRHLRSVRSHIKELASKQYQDYVGEHKADFVSMFIPNEGAYIAAMQLDNHLWEEAYEQRVLLVSPTHLISVLKLIEQVWKQEDTKRYALDIATESGRMYDKFVGFLDDMAAIEKSLGSINTSYAAAMNKLSTGKGNLVNRAEKLRKMGAKATKNISSKLLEASTDEETAE